MFPTHENLVPGPGGLQLGVDFAGNPSFLDADLVASALPSHHYDLIIMSSTVQGVSMIWPGVIGGLQLRLQPPSQLASTPLAM